MKIAYLFFNSAETARRYRDALRERMKGAGYLPHAVTECFDLWFPPKSLKGAVAGTDDAERAADVATEMRGMRGGVMCKVKEA